MSNFLVVDAHCDVITKIMSTDEELYSNTRHFDLQRAKSHKSFVQFFAAYISPDYYPNKAYQRCMDIIKTYKVQIEKNKEHVMPIMKYEQIDTAINQGKIAAILTIENGAALEGDINKLDEFYELGVRSIGLTWNGSNQIACGVGGDNLNGGLTPFGAEVVTRMNKLGILIDVSHINETSFWDVINTSGAPIIASHSNAKKLCPHQRNLTNDQFSALIKNNGVTGINLFPLFLNESGIADINDILNHIEHFMGLGGENNVGIGADFDGISSTPKGIHGVECLGKIFEALLSKNYTEEQVKKIAGLNFLRVLKQTLLGYSDFY